MTILQPKTENQPSKDKCPAFCPDCGADLYYTNTGCICKNKECSWTCKECINEQ